MEEGGWRRDGGSGAVWGKCLLVLTGEGRDRHNGHLYSSGANKGKFLQRGREDTLSLTLSLSRLCFSPCLCPCPCPCPHTTASAAHPTPPARRFALLPSARLLTLIGPPPRFLQPDWSSLPISPSYWSSAVSIKSSLSPFASRLGGHLECGALSAARPTPPQRGAAAILSVAGAAAAMLWRQRGAVRGVGSVVGSAFVSPQAAPLRL